MPEGDIKIHPPEQAAERILIDKLRENGMEDPEVQSLFAAWSEVREQRAMAAEDCPLAQIYFTLERARLYLAAGYKEAARENFSDAKEQAFQEYRDDLVEEIEEELKQVI